MLPVSSAYADIYDRLMTVIETSQGRLGILIAVADERRLREQIIQSYEQEARQAHIEPYRIDLGRGGSIRGKLAELREANPHLQQGGEAVITVTGAELLLRFNISATDEQKTPLEEFFGYLQWTREGMREFPYPIVLWLNHRLLKEISFKAPDFWSWRKGVFWFQEELIPETPVKVVEEVAVKEPNNVLVTANENKVDTRRNLISMYSWLKDKAVDIFLSSNAGGSRKINTNESSQLIALIAEVQQTIAELKAMADSDNLATLYERLGDIYRDRIKKGESPDPQQDAALGFRAFRQAIHRYQTQQDFSSQATALLKLGNFLDDQSRFSEALEAFQELLAIARQTADRWYEAAALGSLGNAYDSLGQYDRAIDFHQQALIISREIGDRRGEGAALGNLGNAYDSLGQYDRAIDFLQQRLTIAREIGDRRGEGIALGNLGNAYKNLGQYDQAIDFHQQSLAIKREIGDRQGEGISLENLGGTLIKVAKYSEALEYLQKALEIDREIGFRSGEAETLKKFAELHQALGDLDLARQYCQQALTLATELGIPLAAECEALLLEIDSGRQGE